MGYYFQSLVKLHTVCLTSCHVSLKYVSNMACLKVKLDGVNIKDLNVRWLREHTGTVSQEPVLFDCSISENIRYGRMDVTNDEIIAAAKEANAHDFIDALPKVSGHDWSGLEFREKSPQDRTACSSKCLLDQKLFLQDQSQNEKKKKKRILQSLT